MRIKIVLNEVLAHETTRIEVAIVLSICTDFLYLFHYICSLYETDMVCLTCNHTTVGA